MVHSAFRRKHGKLRWSPDRSFSPPSGIASFVLASGSMSSHQSGEAEMHRSSASEDLFLPPSRRAALEANLRRVSGDVSGRVARRRRGVTCGATRNDEFIETAFSCANRRSLQFHSRSLQLSFHINAVGSGP